MRGNNRFVGDKAQVIAFYLPQYHPFPENDEWRGTGFTEWTNVGKAKPLFRGHRQPRVPADLGYYDLRLSNVRERQVELAKEAGVYGFCYWHYWFGNGKRLMQNVFDEVLESGKPDFPFCLAWANHSWYSKTFDKDSKGDKLLIEQCYPGDEDLRMHFAFLNRAFKDKRYIKIDEKPLLVIYDPISLPIDYINKLQQMAVDIGWKNGIYLVANIVGGINKKDLFLEKGYNAVTFQRLASAIFDTKNKREKMIYFVGQKLRSLFYHYPKFAVDYKKCIPYLINKDIDSNEEVIPSIIPNWDHTPRSGMKGSMFLNESPALFKLHVEDALEIVQYKRNKLIFLKSWNEWGEGNYMEPDLTFGKGYIHALYEALNNTSTR